MYPHPPPPKFHKSTTQSTTAGAPVLSRPSSSSPITVEEMQPFPSLNGSALKWNLRIGYGGETQPQTTPTKPAPVWPPPLPPSNLLFLIEANITEVVFDSERVLQEQTLKFLIGSLWSRSTDWRYLEAMLRIIYQHPNLSKLVLWTPTTTRVVALYSVADVYVTNSQTKFGETFGRVTIEAMAFGLPVLGTDAGGTKDIVDHNKTGLLHPLGRKGNQVLAQNLQFLLENPIARQEMGARGREKVEKMYLKRHMLEKLAGAISRCMTTI